MSEKPWDPGLYDGRHSFVWKAAADLIGLLAPRRGETILDLGCGTGHLTRAIADAGAVVWGLDHSTPMIEEARRTYPDLRFEIADGHDFHLGTPFDAVFSNAALHWMRCPDAVIACVHEALRPGGRFVMEMGGKGNVGAVHGALEAAIRRRGHEPLAESDLLYFPSVGEYATRLEARGFRVTHALHFDRPTRLEGGDAGLRNWIAMFADRFLARAPEGDREAVLQDAEAHLRPTLHHDGAWWADYRRLRVVAIK
jgi:trans-aconitate methyltransferase